MQREYTVSDIKRWGLGVADQDLFFGPVPITRNYRPTYVLMSAENYKMMISERIETETTSLKQLLEDVVAGDLTPETARQALDELETAMPQLTEMAELAALTVLGRSFYWYAPEPEPTPSIHQLKVTLEGTKPPIWRRVQVDSDTNLRRLHDIIQVVMDWDQSHLYQFTVGRTPVGEPYEADFELVQSAADFTLREVAPDLKARLSYLYDFGDSWKHKIEVEKIMPPEEGVAYPRCVTGKRAAPLEDSGGVWGYARLLDVLADPDDPEHEDRVWWVGTDKYDPEFFDLAAINEQLANFGPGPWEQQEEADL